MIMPELSELDGRKLGLELRRFVCALFGLDDPQEPRGAVGARVKVVSQPAAPPPQQEPEDGSASR